MELPALNVIHLLDLLSSTIDVRLLTAFILELQDAQDALQALLLEHGDAKALLKKSA